MADFPLLPITRPETLRSIKLLSSRLTLPTVIVASYPKSGTTLCQYVVYLLASAIENKRRLSEKKSPLPALSHLSDFSPFLESDRTFDYSVGSSSISAGGVVRPDISLNHESLNLALFNTHLPDSYMPSPSPSIKYIYLVRNAFDVAHSFYHHLSHQSVADGGFVGSEADFAKRWADGEIAFGSWGSHLKMWSDPERPSDREPLVIRYEDMLANQLNSLRSIHDHIWGGSENVHKLDCGEMEALLPFLSVDSMRDNNILFSPKSVEWSERHNYSGEKDGFTFIRKGIVGDGRRNLDEDLLRTFKEGFRRFPAPECFQDLQNDQLQELL